MLIPVRSAYWLVQLKDSTCSHQVIIGFVIPHIPVKLFAFDELSVIEVPFILPFKENFKFAQVAVVSSKIESCIVCFPYAPENSAYTVLLPFAERRVQLYPVAYPVQIAEASDAPVFANLICVAPDTFELSFTAPVFVVNASLLIKKEPIGSPIENIVKWVVSNSIYGSPSSKKTFCASIENQVIPSLE